MLCDDGSPSQEGGQRGGVREVGPTGGAHIQLAAQVFAGHRPRGAAHEELLLGESSLLEGTRATKLPHGQVRRAAQPRARFARGLELGELGCRTAEPQRRTGRIRRLLGNGHQRLSHEVRDRAVRHGHHSDAPPARHQRRDAPRGRVRLARPGWALQAEV